MYVVKIEASLVPFKCINSDVYDGLQRALSYLYI